MKTVSQSHIVKSKMHFTISLHCCLFTITVHVDVSSLLVNLFVQLTVGLPLEVVHGSFRIGLIYGCGVLYGSLAASIFDPYVRLAGASGPAYAMLSAHLANVILHHASMSRPFLRLTGLLAVASLEVGFGIYRRYYLYRVGP